MNKKIIDDFNKISNLQKRQNEFKSMISQFSQSYKYLNAFIEDDPTKNFDSKKILNWQKREDLIYLFCVKLLRL